MEKIITKFSATNRMFNTKMDTGSAAKYVETDPIFVASPAYNISAIDITNWNNKSNFSGNYNDLINKPTIPSKTSELVNNSGFISIETDPTVPSWAKTPNKPSYTANEVGAVPTSRTINGKVLSSDIVLTASDVSALSDSVHIPSNISELINDSGFITSYIETDPIFTASPAHGITSSDIINWNGKSDFSGSYNDLTDKPTIPIVNNATLTIQKNGTTVKTFTANASSNVTANITVPTKVSDLTNDSGYITGYTETDPVFTASAAYGITSNDITYWDGKSDFSGDYNDLINKPTLFSGNYNDLTNKPTIPTADGTTIVDNNGVLSAVGGGASYTAGMGITIENNEISVDTADIATQADVMDKQDRLTAGTGITIDSNNVISATGGGGSINIDNQTIIKKNGVYKTAVGGYTTGGGQTTTYVSNGSGSTSRIVSETSQFTNPITFASNIQGNGNLYASYVINLNGQTATITNQPFSYNTSNTNHISTQGGGYSQVGWISRILGETDSSDRTLLTGAWGLAFQGGGWNAGDTVTIADLTIGTSQGASDIYNGTGSTLTFNNGIQPGSGALLLFPNVVNFTGGTFSCSAGDSSTSFTLSGHLQVTSPGGTVYEDYDFSDTYYFEGGGNMFYSHNSSGMSHTVEIEAVGLNVSNYDGSTSTWTYNGINGVRFNTSGTQGDNSTTVLTNLKLSMGGSPTYVPIDYNFIPIA